MSITLPKDSKKDVRSISPRAKKVEVKKNQDLLPKIQALPGALIPQFIRCGRSNCRCKDGLLHGPYYYRFYREDGKLCKKYVKKADFQAVFAAIQAFKAATTEMRRIIEDEKEQWREARRILRAYTSAYTRIIRL
jgi:hypothetical protein